jgi:hypothetical protein
MPLNCGNKRADSSFPRWCVSIESHGRVILTGKTEKLWPKPVPVPLCLPQISWTDPGANPGLCGEKPATNRLSHDRSDLLLYIIGLAMAHVVSHRPLTAKTRIRVRVNSCGNCGRQSGTGTGFSPNFSVFLCGRSSETRTATTTL